MSSQVENNMIKRKILQAFRMEGLTLKTEAFEELFKVLRENVSAKEHDVVLRNLVASLNKEAFEMGIVNIESLSDLLNDLGKDEEEIIAGEKMKYLSSFRTPRFQYDLTQRRFVADS